jgi:four helix bundle protein
MERVDRGRGTGDRGLKTRRDREDEMDDERPETETGRENGGRYKFQRLQVYQLALDHLDMAYNLAATFPKSENLNLRSQLERASTSIVLNIAEGSTGQTDAEQARFLGLALRSLMECVACLDVVERRRYAQLEELNALRLLGHQLFIKIQAMRHSLNRRPEDGRWKTNGPSSVRGRGAAR